MFMIIQPDFIFNILTISEPLKKDFEISNFTSESLSISGLSVKNIFDSDVDRDIENSTIHRIMNDQREILAFNFLDFHFRQLEICSLLPFSVPCQMPLCLFT